MSLIEKEYTTKASSTNSGCLLFLIDHSGSMKEPMVGYEKKQKADFVAEIMNHFLQELRIVCSEGGKIKPRFDVGLISYGDSIKLAFNKLFSVSELDEHVLRTENVTRLVPNGTGGFIESTFKFPIWIEPQALGNTPMCETLSLAFRLIKDWINETKTNGEKKYDISPAPIVMNITDGESTDGDPTLYASAITNLSTRDGNVLLFNCHISSKDMEPIHSLPIAFPNVKNESWNEYAKRLFDISSTIPKAICDIAVNKGYNVANQARGFTYNADAAQLIQFLNIGSIITGIQLSATNLPSNSH